MTPTDKPVPTPSTAKPKAEAREHVRIPVSWKVRVLLDSGAILETHLIDVSEGGFGMFCDDPLPAHGARDVAIAVPLPEDHAHLHVIRARMKVAFQVFTGGKFRVGAQFVQLDDAAHQLIKRCMSAAAKRG